MAKNVYCRKPLGQREAHIIKRMKKVGRAPVTTIAKVTERNKTTIYDVLQGRSKFAKRGPKQKLMRKDANLIVKILRGMIQKAIHQHISKNDSLHTVNIQSTLQSTLKNTGKNTVYIKNE